MQRRARNVRPQAGFTLLEAMVALLLSALLLALTVSGLRTFVRSGNLVAAFVDDRAQAHAVGGFLRDQLRQLAPLAITAGQQNVVLFRGTRDSLEYVGHLPTHRAAGGLFFSRLRRQASGRDDDLVFSYARLPHGSDWTFEDLQALLPAEEKTLLDDIEEMNIEYSSGGSAAAEWVEDWPLNGSAPRLVRLTLTDKRGDTRSLTVGVRSQFDAQSDALRIDTKGTKRDATRKVPELEMGAPVGFPRGMH